MTTKKRSRGCRHGSHDGTQSHSARRFKDVIKTGGEKVASIEVEKAIYAADPSVQEAAVIGLPHEHWGEAVTAIVVLKEGAQAREADLLDKLRGQ